MKPFTSSDTNISHLPGRLFTADGIMSAVPPFSSPSKRLIETKNHGLFRTHIGGRDGNPFKGEMGVFFSFFL